MPRSCRNGFSCSYKPRCHFEHPEGGNFAMVTNSKENDTNAKPLPIKESNVEKRDKSISAKETKKARMNDTEKIDKIREETKVNAITDMNSLMKIDMDSVDNNLLFNIENIIAGNWDVIKEEQTSLMCRKLVKSEMKEEKVENVKVEMKEKTIELGSARDHEELVIEAFTFNIEGFVAKACRMSLFKKYDLDDDEHVEIYPKKRKEAVGFPMIRVSDHKKDLWKAGINRYISSRGLSTKNKERLETKLNRIQGPMIKSLTDGTWKPHKVVTEPDFFVHVEESEDLVAFGDFWDAKKTESQNLTPSLGDTILYNVNTVRSFTPGLYRLTVVTLKEKDFLSPVAIIHHDSVSPYKIVRKLLLTRDTPDFTPKVANSLNRYDWCHSLFGGQDDSSNGDGEDDFIDDYEDEDSDEDGQYPSRKIAHPWGYSLYRDSKKSIIYFTPVAKSSSFKVGVKKGFHKYSTDIHGAYQIYGPAKTDEDEKEKEKNDSKYQQVSIGIDM